MSTHQIIQPLRDAYPGSANAHLNTLLAATLHDGIIGAREYASTYLPLLSRIARARLIILVMQWANEGITSVIVNE